MLEKLPDEGAGDELSETRSEAVRLSNWERITLADESKIQSTLSRMHAKVGLLSLPPAMLQTRVEEVKRAVSFYRQQKYQSDPESYFLRPETLPDVSELGHCRLSSGEVVDIQFPSRYRPQQQEFTQEFDSNVENKMVHVRLWRHPEGCELGTIVALHGWRMGDSRLSALTLIPGYFFRLGLNVALVELPYHGKRAPSIAPRGSYFPSAHVVRTNEGFAQAIHDVRSFALWLESEGKGPIGALGLSLGGYLASLWASLDELSCVMCISPMVDMAEVAMRLIGENRSLLSKKAVGFFDSLPQELLDEAFAVHSPLSYRPKVAEEGRLILAGLADEIIPASQPERLSKHWDDCPVHWVTSEHLNHAIEPRTFRVLRDFLCNLGLAHSELLRISHRE